MPPRAKHPSARTRRNLDGPEWRKLPSEGRGRKAAPAWPLQPDRQLRLAVDAAKSEVAQIETAIEGTEDRKDRIALARQLRREKSRLAALQGDARLAPPPCPAWCTQPNHDGFGEMPGTDLQMQVHTGDVVQGVDVLVCIDEYRDAADVVTYGKPYIHSFGTAEMLDADGASALGAALTLAAAKVREIQATG